MTRAARLALLAGLSLAPWLVRATALAADFTHDGTIVLDGGQLRLTSDGFNPGLAWEATMSFPAPVTVNAGDNLRGTVSFGANLLRVRDNGGGFFRVGTVDGFEQLVALASANVPSQISQTNNSLFFNGVLGPALATGGTRVGGINFNGLFMQVVVDVVSPGQEVMTGGIVYRLGLVSGGPFTIEGIRFRVLAEEIGIEPRAVGDLTYGDCITGESESGPSPGSGACAAIESAQSLGDNSGLNNLRSVAASADGASLYAVSAADDAVVRFDRDPATGALTYQGCITGETESGTDACVQIDSATSAGTNSGLDVLQAVVVSADGKSLYAVSVLDDAVVRFDRDPTTGALTYQGCITGETESGPTGTDACVEIASASSLGVNSGLDELFALALSADGKSLYAISNADDAVARFDRDPATGALSYQGCFTGESESGPTGTDACAEIGSASSNGVNSGLDHLNGVAVSADGKSVYAVSLFDDAVARFDRDSTAGALTYRGCITGETESGPGVTDACAQIASATSNGVNSGLDELYSLALSPDGRSLYAVAEQDDAVVRFDRDSTTGALTYQGCITGETESAPIGRTVCTRIGSATAGGTNSGFDKLRSVAVSAGGTSLYVASPADDAVARFDRDPATGALTYVSCFTGETETGPTGTKACAQIGSATSFGINSGLDNPQSFAVTADERSLYAASGNDAAVARFDLAQQLPCVLDVDQSGGAEVATDIVYIARHLFGLSPVPPSFRGSNPDIPPDVEIAARVDAIADVLDVDTNQRLEVATDVVYIARHLFGLSPVPPSFRETNPNILPDFVIRARVDALCP